VPVLRRWPRSRFPLSGKGMRRVTGWVLILGGGLLLGISLAGTFAGTGNYFDAPSRSWERFDPLLASGTPDVESLFQTAQALAGRRLRNMPPSDAMNVLCGLTMDRFTHGNRATYSPSSNWILWMLGLAEPRFRDIQDPDTLLRYGHSALCGDVSHVLIRLAEKAGIPARHVLLNGHIVMEAWYDGNWHAYDPDLEVVLRDGQGRVPSVMEMAGSPDRIRDAYSVRGDSSFLRTILQIYGNIPSHRYIAYPRGSIFGPRGQRPGRVEQAAKVARFAVPSAILVAGLLLIRAGNRRNRRNVP
jgi:hypothetical protein